MNTRKDALEALEKLAPFMGKSQMATVKGLFRSEEKQFFYDKMVELTNVVETMPKTMEQDGKGEDAIVFLHYFSGNCDWHITEKDAGSPDDEPGVGQVQAFGMANLGYGPELGYVSIQELIDNDIELDFHWTPKTIREIKVA